MTRIGRRAIKTSIKEPKEVELEGNNAFIKFDQTGLEIVKSKFPDIFLLKIIRRVMVRIGPIEAIPTKPKESFVEFFPPLTIATPAPKDKIKGTVALPVVIPPLSKINGRKVGLSSAHKIMSIKVIA